jgi:MoaA/NifB/PqqE/SkfB family radical SAM enzyme
MDSKARTRSLARRGIANFFLRRPFCISFEVTYNCNAQCKHCHLGGAANNPRETRAPAERFGELARRFKPVVAQISGGEPLLRPDIVDVIRSIRVPDRPPFIVLTTNGTLLTRAKYDELIEAGVDEFSLSLDYPDERHDAFRAVPGLFKKIRTLMESFGPDDKKAVTLSGVVQRDNFRDLEAMADQARAWGVRMNFSTYTWLRTRKKEFMIPPEEMEELKATIDRLIEHKRRHDTIYTSEYVFRNMIVFFETGSVPNCRAGIRFYVVNPNGTLSPCGLIIKDYTSPRQIRRDFFKSNDCTFCYTSIRGGSERPVKYLIKDNIHRLRRPKRAAA